VTPAIVVSASTGAISVDMVPVRTVQSPWGGFRQVSYDCGPSLNTCSCGRKVPRDSTCMCRAGWW